MNAFAEAMYRLLFPQPEPPPVPAPVRDTLFNQQWRGRDGYQRNGEQLAVELERRGVTTEGWELCSDTPVGARLPFPGYDFKRVM